MTTTTMDKEKGAYRRLQKELVALYESPTANVTAMWTKDGVQDWYGADLPLTDDDLSAIAARAHGARPGPWHWTHDVVNQYYTTIYGRRHARERYVHLLQGRPPGSYMDMHDAPVMSLRWRDLKGTTFFGSLNRGDSAFIENALTDVMRLLAEVRRLRGQLTAREG